MKQIQGQMSIFDRIEAPQKAAGDALKKKKDPPQEQKPPEEFKDYIGRCEYCCWGEDESSCDYSEKNPKAYYKGELACKNKGHWRPNTWKIPKLCANCKHSNQFVYVIKPEYAPVNGKYNKKAIEDPVEEPNIYCTKWKGSVNRKKAFPQYETPGFGVGRYHRQHEYDTCDAWEPDDIMMKKEKKCEE